MGLNRMGKKTEENFHLLLLLIDDKKWWGGRSFVSKRSGWKAYYDLPKLSFC